jgi:pSer/pThr/pTyr-binding forkhead associated (FHA) protein
MRLDIISQGETTPVELADGSVTIGGGAVDDIQLQGLPVRLVTLVVDGGRLTLKAIRPVRMGEQLFPANVARLVLPGEGFSLPNDVVVRRPDDEAARERRKNVSTDFLARELLKGTGEQLEMRAASLTCVAGADEGHVFPLAYVETVIGRGDEVDVRLRDRSVSRRHANLVHHRGGYVIEALGSTNGVYVNGEKVDGSRRLSKGDVIELGHSMLRFDAGEQAPEERTVIQPLEALQAPKPPAPARPTAEADEQKAITDQLPPPRVNRTADIAIGVIGVLFVLSGLATALAFSS